jgi:hypothetical protein
VLRGGLCSLLRGFTIGRRYGRGVARNWGWGCGCDWSSRAGIEIGGGGELVVVVAGR